MLTPPEKKKFGKQPIRKEVFESPWFTEFHDLLYKRHIHDLLAPFARLSLHKQVIKEAARMTRNKMITAQDTSNYSRNQILTTIARAVSRNDTNLAMHLLTNSPTVVDMVRIDSNDSGIVSVNLVDPTKFSTEVNKAKGVQFNEDLADIDRLISAAGVGGDHLKRKKSSLRNLSKLWSPFDKRLVLSGVRTGVDENGWPKVARGPLEQCAALRDYWSSLLHKIDGC